MPTDPLINDQTGLSEPLPINTMGSGSADTPSEPLESSRNVDIPVSLNNANQGNTPILTKNQEVLKPTESTSVEVENPKTEPISELTQTSETETAQIPLNEPLNPEPEPLESAPVSTPQSQTVSSPVFFEPQQNKTSLARELLNKAKNAIQFRKRKKLDKIMAMFLKKSKITNDEVEKFLHVSDATAERYLNTLEKENKIKQVEKTGKGVSYSRI